VRCTVIHIVKRFGRVGGMETYVWHLVHGLVTRGIRVAVVCEQVCESPGDGIDIVKVEVSAERPRWKSMMTFRTRVDKKIREMFFGQSVLIHSHERSLSHQVTTFHGPPIDPPRYSSWLSLFNKRFIAWQQFEREELLGPSVQMVLPVSSRIKKQLTDRYPEIVDKAVVLAWPGVENNELNSSFYKPICLDKTKFIFVGKEWRRKGLDIAIRVVAEFRRSHPGATLTVFGVEASGLPRSILGFDWVSYRSWTPSIPWSDYDLLLHPARKEPFGMVVAEARSNGLPVIMSSQVGAADLEFSNTKILDLSDPIRCWSEAARELASLPDSKPETKWAWNDLVTKHTQIIYPQLEMIPL